MAKAKIFLIPRETNILHPAIRIEVADSGLTLEAALSHPDLKIRNSFTVQSSAYRLRMSPVFIDRQLLTDNRELVLIQGPNNTKPDMARPAVNLGYASI